MRYILTLLLLSAAILKTAAQENYTLADTLTLDAVVVTGEKLLFESEQEFSKTQVLHKNKENNLRVEDLLKVSKYSIAFAEMMNPDEENKELASAAITVFQGIETVLNNKPQDIPINKKLHIANGFLSSIVKVNIEDKDTKRGITITSTLIDLVIDFFTSK